MARSGPLLTEAQWKKIAPLLPKPPQHRQGGRPWIENCRDARLDITMSALELACFLAISVGAILDVFCSFR